MSELRYLVWAVCLGVFWEVWGTVMTVFRSWGWGEEHEEGVATAVHQTDSVFSFLGFW